MKDCDEAIYIELGTYRVPRILDSLQAPINTGGEEGIHTDSIVRL